MDAQADNTIPSGSNETQRDASGWVLSAVSLSVLAIGVLVIRSTRSEPAKLPVVPSTPEITAQPGDNPADTTPQVIVALPEPRP